jgi:hypothetical protein
MKKFFTWFVIVLAVIILVAGYFGLVPGLSDAMGANKAKDLGVKYTDADLQKARATTGVSLQDKTEGTSSLEYSGEKSISGDYSNEMITAMINGAKYIYYPLTNTQVKISPDGTIETAGNFNISKALSWSTDVGGSQVLADQAKPYTKFVSNNPSFYLKGTMSVKDNNITVDIKQAQISRFTAPKSIIDKYQGELATFVESKIKAIPGMNVKSADFSTGTLKLDATYPAVSKTKK